MATKKVRKTSAELKTEIANMKAQLKETQKLQRQAEREEAAERERIARQKRIEEALELVEMSKSMKLQSGQTMYDFLKSECLKKKSQTDVKSATADEHQKSSYVSKETVDAWNNI